MTPPQVKTSARQESSDPFREDLARAITNLVSARKNRLFLAINNNYFEGVGTMAQVMDAIVSRIVTLIKSEIEAFELDAAVQDAIDDFRTNTEEW